MSRRKAEKEESHGEDVRLYTIGLARDDVPLYNIERRSVFVAGFWGRYRRTIWNLKSTISSKRDYVAIVVTDAIWSAPPKSRPSLAAETEGVVREMFGSGFTWPRINLPEPQRLQIVFHDNLFSRLT